MSPCFTISIVLGIPVNDVADVTPDTVNGRGLKTAFLLDALYFTVTVVVKPGFTLMNTVSLFNNPWVPDPTTETVLRCIWPVTASLKFVFKLWISPVPVVKKYTRSIFVFVPTPTPPTTLLCSVDPIPTKVPVDPIPILTVDNPIKLSSNFATNKGESSKSVTSAWATLLSNLTLKGVPSVWYVTSSPVSKPWFNR